MNKVIVGVIATASVFFASCKTEHKNEAKVAEDLIEETLVQEELTTDELEDIVTLFIASEKADCAGVAEMKCLLVRETEDMPWELMYDPIEGFTYEPGYEYSLEIKRETVANPPADGSSIRYILVREISKIKKN
ncbi:MULTISPECIES: DUF4377 domain-containing protein [Myroides]|uniref:DUF4377 domain-containing protein n=1 Tax=Myroides albus TaxID=2562892 RepID=A0A6I3LJY7_9FLAO|nr:MULTISPECIES: DUF4377 domain-containing protein [Myroides]MTG98593.1 DUF4377 domain-containing protein [Myroides albus]MVX36625.1 DUF4377 domain-containing protein [Myroides sp. LoEW2-1]UVD79963.1 DUF4377 domain-containing protein [Myroides albus]